MDKELLRIIIIAIGLLVIIGMLLWGYFRNRRVSLDMSYFDERDELKGSGNSHYSQDYPDDDYDDDVVPLGTARFAQEHQDDYAESELSAHADTITPSASAKSTFHQEGKTAPVNDVAKVEARESLPRLVQFSVVAKNEQGFNGSDLTALFNMVGLEYGSMKIYERLDINRMVDFGVASMVNPGTFPESDAEMADFYTPGVTFFMQPRELPDPILVYDDLVRTINLIAKELDGQKWDAERKPLSEFTLKIIRKSLQVN